MGQKIVKKQEIGIAQIVTKYVLLKRYSYFNENNANNIISRKIFTI